MFAFAGEQRRCVAMPLGGLGTGNLAICGDGSLRQWQLRNLCNHVGYVPYGFFAARWRGQHLRERAVLLQTREFWDEPDFRPAASVTDHVVPEQMVKTLGGLPTVPSTIVLAAYPTMEIEYDLEAPVELRLTAWNPCVREDAEASGWPVAIFDFDVTNRSDSVLDFSLLSSFQNSVGWDGVSVIEGVENVGYGGNLNRRVGDHLVMENVQLPEDHPSQGQMLLAGTGGERRYCPQWSELNGLWTAFRQGGIGSLPQNGPSPAGRTWNAAMSQRIELKAGESKRLTFLLAWHFPNRYVDWAQWETLIPAGKSRFYLGNHYASRGLPMLWADEFLSKVGELRNATLEYWNDVHAELPEQISRAVGSCVANLRTNVCLWTEDGRFYGFEGGHGASTWQSSGGCCAMSCTHVWNYEQGLVELWPDLFRSMRESDWEVNQQPDGQLPHRITLPVYVKKLWDHPIGGPERPALDGLCAGVLKTYQYYLRSADEDWMSKVWPRVKRGVEWMMTKADRGDGLIEGEQPNTYDIHLYGPNTFIGSQYLAALLAAERMAELAGESAEGYRERFESGSAKYDETCFNGEYYVQRIPDGCDEPYQFGEGCVTDQLLGQWWAHHLDLGYVLSPENVRSAVSAVFNRNFRSHFVGFKQDPRVFASEDDRGLLIATYEPGQRRKIPLLYSDEVWTGVEYAFASLCFYEGLVDEGLEVVSAARDRYSGRERNPFNEVECGDHYIRALSAWSLPKAWRAANPTSD